MSENTILDRIDFITGNKQILKETVITPPREPFSDDICYFLSEVSKVIMADKRSRQYSDVVTFAFWIRNASLSKLKERFLTDDGSICTGRGIAFHIAPSNVPVNFAYSLATGLITGNANIVRIPSKNFPQVGIITDAINMVLDSHEEFRRYILLCRYDRDREINDFFSSMADVRIVWGGDRTIEEIRKSPLPPRSVEITFADRYSIAVIDSDMYMNMDDKDKIASDFYNDTFFSDQNACTSPRIVVWAGHRRDEAKEAFWEKLHNLVIEKYTFQDITSINKLTQFYLAVSEVGEIKMIPHNDNLIIRMAVSNLDKLLMDHRESCGFFYEYDCDDVMELSEICNDKRCQTIGFLGNIDWLKPLIESGIKGVDRVVDIGKTMDFDLIWDGYDLMSMLTRKIVL